MTILTASTNAITLFIQGYFSELKISGGSIGLIYGIGTVLSAAVFINSHYLIKLKLKSILILTTIMYFVGAVFLITLNVPLVIVGFFLIYLQVDFLEPSVYYFINQEVKEEARTTVLSSLGAGYSLVTLLLYPLYGVIGQSYGYRGMILISVVLSSPLFAYLFRFYQKYNVGKINHNPESERTTI